MLSYDEWKREKLRHDMWAFSWWVVGLVIGGAIGFLMAGQ